MKSIFLFVMCALMMAGAPPLFGGVDPMQVVTDYFTPRPGQRVTGKATLVHKVWKKAISEEEWEKGNHFANDQEKAVAKAMITAMAHVDFTQKKDEAQYEVVQVLMDHARVRKNILKVTEKQAQACKSMADVAALFKQSPPDVYAYDGAKTVDLVHDQSTAGIEVEVVQDKIWVPEFWTWGAAGVPGGEKLPSMIRDGKIKLSAVERNGLVHATLTIGESMTLEYVIDPTKDNSLAQASVGGLADAVASKGVYDQYVQVPGGCWFPMDYREETYVRLNGKSVLVKLDEYRAIPGSVEIDTPLPKDAFVVKLAPGTVVSDMRSNPSKYVVIPPGGDRFEGP